MYETIAQRLEEAKKELKEIKLAYDYIDSQEQSKGQFEAWKIIKREYEYQNEKVNNLEEEVSNRYVINGHDLRSVSQHEREIMMERLSELAENNWFS